MEKNHKILKQPECLNSFTLNPTFSVLVLNSHIPKRSIVSIQNTLTDCNKTSYFVHQNVTYYTFPCTTTTCTLHCFTYNPLRFLKKVRPCRTCTELSSETFCFSAATLPFLFPAWSYFAQNCPRIDFRFYYKVPPNKRKFVRYTRVQRRYIVCKGTRARSNNHTGIPLAYNRPTHNCVYLLSSAYRPVK